MDAIVKIIADRAVIAKKSLLPNAEAEALAVLAATKKAYRFANDAVLMDIKNREKTKKAVLQNGIPMASQNVCSVDWSPDGSLLAIASTSDAIQIMDPVTCEVVRTLDGHTGLVHCVVWSPSGKFLASGSDDMTVRTWNIEDGSVIKTMQSTKPVLEVAWSPDEQFLTSGCGGPTLYLWEAATGRLVKALEGADAHAFTFTASWSPDGRFFASTSDFPIGTVALWDANTHQVVKHLNGHSKWVAGVVWETGPWSWSSHILGWTAVMAWSADGRFLATGSWDKSICIWDIASGAIVHRLEGHQDIITCVAWSPNGRYLASTAISSPLFIWSASTGEIMAKVDKHLSSIMSIRWSPDSAFVLMWRPNGHFRKTETGGDVQTVRVWYVPDLIKNK